MGDVAYPIRLWFYSPFKGEKDGSLRANAHWNFIQSSTRMVVESLWYTKRVVEDFIEEK